MFDVKDRIAVITGGYGVLGSSMARCLARQGAKIVILGRQAEKGEKLVEELKALGTEAYFGKADVLNKAEVERVCAAVVQLWGRVDILINAAGGNKTGATIAPGQTILDMDIDAYQQVLDLNLKGTVIPTLVFGRRKDLLSIFLP